MYLGYTKLIFTFLFIFSSTCIICDFLPQTQKFKSISHLIIDSKITNNQICEN